MITLVVENMQNQTCTDRKLAQFRANIYNSVVPIDLHYIRDIKVEEFVRRELLIEEIEIKIV